MKKFIGLFDRMIPSLLIVAGCFVIIDVSMNVVRSFAQESVLESETGFNAPVAEAAQGKQYTVDFPALRPGDTVTVRFLVTEEASPDAVEMTFSMPTTDTLVAIYAEQFGQAQAGLDQVLKALDADPESVVDTAIYQQNVVGEKAALKRVAETIRPIIIGRGVNGVIRAKRASK